MRRIFSAFLVAGFAVFSGCGEVPESSGGQGGGGDGGGGSGAAVDSAAECFDFLEDERAEYDGAVEDMIYSLQSTSTPWDPGCLVDGVGYDPDWCIDNGHGVDQVEYYNICQEYREWPPDHLGAREPCMWKVAAELEGDICEYYLVCLTEDDYPGVESYGQAFPPDWDEAVGKYCVN